MDGPVPFRQLPYNLKTSPASSVVGVFVDVTPGLLSACGNFASASVPPVASRALTRRPQRGSVPSVWKALRPGRHGGRQCSRPHRARIETAENLAEKDGLATLGARGKTFPARLKRRKLGKSPCEPVKFMKTQQLSKDLKGFRWSAPKISR